ncbi:MAG: MATE family efflux transporter [Erysipelotrichaceae bacterium]|nr:MATE family efflux transporter [Erysipelotrichaceae bacterium]
MRIQLSDHFTYSRLLRFVFPSMVMMLFTSLYGIVDGLFVSNFAGKQAFAAINLILPYLGVIGGIGFLIGTGGTAYIGKLLGEQKREKANEVLSMLVMFLFLGGIIISAVSIVFVKPIAVFLGANETILGDCILYGVTMLAFNTAWMMQNAFQSILIVAEQPKLGLRYTILAGITNMILDALFVWIFQWGLAGAAYATGISQLIGTALPLLYFSKSENRVIHFRKFRWDFPVLFQCCLNGLSEFMTTIAFNIISVVYNWQLIRFAGNDGIAAYGVILYVTWIFYALFSGYNVGYTPIVSYHYGAENHMELTNVLMKSILILTGMGVVLTAFGQWIAEPFGKAYIGYDPALLAMTIHGLRIDILLFLFCPINMLASSFFTALNNGPLSALISTNRTFLCQLFCIVILPQFLQLDGIWLSNVIAEILALCLSVPALLVMRKKYHY